MEAAKSLFNAEVITMRTCVKDRVDPRLGETLAKIDVDLNLVLKNLPTNETTLGGRLKGSYTLRP